MKVGRRAFLQFTAGVVGGSLLTPIPWKLADDSAIWSQNWSWRPSPERGEVTQAASTCVLCNGGCGIRAKLVDGKRAIAIEGNPAHPINRGGICPLGAAGAQFLYAPYRLSNPMKQTKKRGDPGGFQPIAWDEALKELGSLLSKLRSEGNANALACITGARRSSMDELWQQFFAAYGSANLFKMPTHADSRATAASLLMGKAADVAFALEKATYILSFGASFLDGWGAPGRVQAAYGSWRSGNAVKLVQVESRCSMTAAKADRWVAVAPGTEAALALAIAHVMVKDKLFDAAFVEANVFGFEDWTDGAGKSRKGFKSLLLASYAPEQIAERTGIEAPRIRELAREFASQKNAVAIWGTSQSNVAENVYHDLAFLALNVLKGNLRADGLVSLVPDVPFAPLPDVQLDNAAQAGIQKKRLDLALTRSAPCPSNGLYPFLDALAKGGPYPIDVLLVHEANPVYSLAENQVLETALAKVGTVVSFSSYMDETAQQADLILPNHMAFERLDDVIGLPGVPAAYYAIASPIIKPQLDTKHAGDVVLGLAKTLGGAVAGSLPWPSYEAYLKERVKGLAASGKGALADSASADIMKPRAGESVKANYGDAAGLWKKLASGGCWYDAPADPLNDLSTASKKIELACQLLQKKGLTLDEDAVYLPHFAQLSPSGTDKDFPLLLVGYEMLSLSSEYLPNPPFMTKTLWDFVLKGNDLYVELHPQTAKAQGMGEGSRAALRTPQGEVPVRVHMTPAARPGVVYVVNGLGHKAYDEYIQNKGANANRVIEVQVDPITGLGTAWATRAQLVRV